MKRLLLLIMLLFVVSCGSDDDSVSAGLNGSTTGIEGTWILEEAEYRKNIVQFSGDTYIVNQYVYDDYEEGEFYVMEIEEGTFSLADGEMELHCTKAHDRNDMDEFVEDEDALKTVSASYTLEDDVLTISGQEYTKTTEEVKTAENIYN